MPKLTDEQVSDIDACIKCTVVIDSCLLHVTTVYLLKNSANICTEDIYIIIIIVPMRIVILSNLFVWMSASLHSVCMRVCMHACTCICPCMHVRINVVLLIGIKLKSQYHKVTII